MALTSVQAFKGPLVAAIDQGTQSTRLLVFDLHSLSVVASSQSSITQHVLQPGWCEHDPVELFSSVAACMKDVAEAMSVVQVQRIRCVGITNQRETTVAWDKITGLPLCKAIVWHDTRTASFVSELKERGYESLIRSLTGLPVSTYFSGLKMRWMLENDPEVRKAADEHRLAFGTVDSWLVYKLTGKHVTDTSNASRTMLMNIHHCNWDEQLLKLFDVPLKSLPEIIPSCFHMETVRISLENCAFSSIPISGILGDQQAAALGQNCLLPGVIKNTYGTGCFMMSHIGRTLPLMNHDDPLIATVHFSVGKKENVYFALEGAVASAGSSVSWLVDNIKLIGSPAESEVVASSVPDCGDVYFVPALSGLFAPYWKPDARGCWVGLSQYTTRSHLVRSVLEGVALQCAAIIHCIQCKCGQDGKSQTMVLKADGGMTTNSLLMQMQADFSGVEVECAKMAEATALGVALASALGFGLFDSIEQISDVLTAASNEIRRFSPRTNAEERTYKLSRWEAAVHRSFDWKS
nr:glycerol kinase 2 [Andalucia godoyi]|eukprot:ANDGO_05704.mRNA.1 Glycerol kinase 2